jgi:CHASE3 domain sensor protein
MRASGRLMTTVTTEDRGHNWHVIAVCAGCGTRAEQVVSKDRGKHALDTVRETTEAITKAHKCARRTG